MPTPSQIIVNRQNFEISLTGILTDSEISQCDNLRIYINVWLSRYIYNDSTFSAADYRNLSQIGQGSKLEKMGATGRFGLGFNAVYHFTDVPSFVSGDHLVFFDPH